MARAVGGSISTEPRRRLVDTLVEGFFPMVGANARPQRTRRVGLQELGLPYAADAAITKHLARFLADLAADSVEQGIRLRRGPSGLAAPTHVLFNGGVMKAAVLRDRVRGALDAWLVADGFPPLGKAGVMEAPDLDHAVARGARLLRLTHAARRAHPRRAPRTYYGLESACRVPGLEARQGLCVVPSAGGGTEATIRARVRPRDRRGGDSVMHRRPEAGQRRHSRGGLGPRDRERHPLEVT